MTLAAVCAGGMLLPSIVVDFDTRILIAPLLSNVIVCKCRYLIMSMDSFACLFLQVRLCLVRILPRLFRGTIRLVSKFRILFSIIKFSQSGLFSAKVSQ